MTTSLRLSQSLFLTLTTKPTCLTRTLDTSTLQENQKMNFSYKVQAHEDKDKDTSSNKANVVTSITGISNRTSGFRTEDLAEVFDVDEDTTRNLQGLQEDRRNI
ncbi:hypothetical protein CFP56_034998, partial [Quercus suber]